MWMGEQITEFGIGNGISIILFAGIVSRVPSMVGTMISSTCRLPVVARSGGGGILALIVFITWVNGAERRIPVQYAKRVVGRKMYGGQYTHLPMKVNMSGVLPIIFAQSIAIICPPRSRVYRHRAGYLLGLPEQACGQQERTLHDRLLPDDHRLQLLLCHHPVQPH